MIVLRIMVAAFLSNVDDFLVMKRSLTRKLAPGMWSGVGGHVEATEFNTPECACMREIYEETGLTSDDIEDLKLKYIVLRRKEDEIRVQYVYFGKSKRRDVSQSNEGELFWVDCKDILNLEMTPSIKFVLRHYFSCGINNDDIYTGTVSEDKCKSVINWSKLEDYEKGGKNEAQHPCSSGFMDRHTSENKFI